MQKIYSKAEDCYQLYKILKRKMGNKIKFCGTPYTELFSGKYYSDNDYLFEKGIPFYYKFCQNGFLRVQVGSNAPVGEKLAVLSDFYEALSEEFGEPTVFYSTEDDDEELLSMHWSFINKEEDIQKFEKGTFFDDNTETNELIIIGKPNQKTDSYQLNDITKKTISKRIGFPLELLPLVDENIEDFIKFKTGKELSVPTDAKMDGVPVTAYENKKTLQYTKKIN